MATNPPNQTVVKAKYKRNPPFKAGSDLTKEVSLIIGVDIENHSTEDEDNISITIRARNVEHPDELDDQP